MPGSAFPLAFGAFVLHAMPLELGAGVDIGSRPCIERAVSGITDDVRTILTFLLALSGAAAAHAAGPATAKVPWLDTHRAAPWGEWVSRQCPSSA